jgi:hypothetical protein
MRHRCSHRSIVFIGPMIWKQKKPQAGLGPEPGVNRDAGSAGGAADRVGDAGERLVGIGAQGRDRRDAHDNNEGQHDGIFDRRWAIFTLEEVHDAVCKRTHGSFLSATWQPARQGRRIQGFVPPSRDGFTLVEKRSPLGELHCRNYRSGFGARLLSLPLFWFFWERERMPKVPAKR